jgi:hypothetical protein
MKNILKILSLLLIVLTNIVIFYYDYYFYNSFYHSLIIVGLLCIGYCTYKVINTLNELLFIFRKWLGN